MWAALPEPTVFHTACHFFPLLHLYSIPVVDTLECQFRWCRHFPVCLERSSHQAPTLGWQLQRNRTGDIFYHTFKINISKSGNAHKRFVVCRWKLEVSIRRQSAMDSSILINTACMDCLRGKVLSSLRKAKNLRSS